MTGEEFETFLEHARAELKRKQEHLERTHGIGSYARWWFEQAVGKLQFFDSSDRLALEADVVLIGSYSPKSKTWKWAWSNPSLLPPLRANAERLKELQGITGFAMFGSDQAVPVEDEAQAWEIAAMAVSHVNAEGCYRGPATDPNGPRSFFALTKLTKVRLQ